MATEVSTWRSERVGDLMMWVRGRGERVLVLLHGGPGLSDYTQSLGDVLATRLADGAWKIARFQQRGLAPSTVSGPFTIEQHVADVLDVCAALTHQPVVVVGHSWGGHLAMHLAVAAPHRIGAAIIIDPLGAVPDGGTAAMTEYFTARLSRAEAAEYVRLEQRSVEEGPSSEIRLAQLALLWPYYFSDPASAPPMPAIRVGVEVSDDTFASINAHFEQQTLERGLPGTPIPTLFLAGTKSPIPHHESERSSALMPHSEVITRPVGHFTWLEDPAWTAAAVADFLRTASHHA
jgi:proline iminopeptidase